MKRNVSLVVLLIAQGCAHSAEPILLTIDYAPPRSAPAFTRSPLRVGPVQLPPALDRPQLTVQRSAGRLDMDEGAQWSAPLERLVRQALIRDLGARVAEGRLLADEESIMTADTLAVEILALEVEDATLRIHGSWSITQASSDRRKRRELAGTAFTLSEPLADQSPTSIATGLAALIGQIADQVSTAVPRT